MDVETAGFAKGVVLWDHVRARSARVVSGPCGGEGGNRCGVFVVIGLMKERRPGGKVGIRSISGGCTEQANLVVSVRRTEAIFASCRGEKATVALTRYILSNP